MTSPKDFLIWKKFPVLDSGFVSLVDVMGSDASVVQAARVSYGKDVRGVQDINKEVLLEILAELDLPLDAEVLSALNEEKVMDRYRQIRSKSDRDLLRFLMRHRHTTPFEMCELKFMIRCPMDCWRQWIRHRTASVNEYSTRYTEAIDDRQTTNPGDWRLQASENKQGSSGYLGHWPEEIPPLHDLTGNVAVPETAEGEGYPSPGDFLTEQENELHITAQRVYEDRLALGVAKEQARKDLPLSTYTEAYWKINLHNLIHFLGLRMDSHAQKEIRDYATTIGEKIVAPLFPETWAAFQDYHPHMKALLLTALDIQAVQYITEHGAEAVDDLSGFIKNKRELSECLEKLKRLKLIGSDKTESIRGSKAASGPKSV